MFKKLNIKILVIILVVLVAIYFLTDLLGDNDRSFKSQIVEVDTAKVTDIYINIPKDKAEISLTRTGGTTDWSVESGGQKFPADAGVVKNILSQFADLKPERVAATSKEKWGQYEVSDSAGTRVKLKNGKTELVDIYVGKFSYTQPPQQPGQQQNPYQQQRGKMTSFVRLADETKVYAVEGFMKMSYQKDMNSYRNKSLLKVNKDDVSRLVFSYPGNVTMTVAKNESGKWQMNGMPADSTKTVRYLNKIAKLTSSNFIDPSTPKNSIGGYKLNIEGNNFTPVEINAIPTPDTLVKYIITSSINPDAEFDGTKGKLFEKVFVTETEFLPDVK